MVGGTTPSRMASRVAAMPAAPQAPCGWPIMLFNDEPASLYACPSKAGFQTHPMIGFAGGTVAGDLAVNVRAARLGPLHLFHHEEPRALGQHEAVAILG